MTLEDEALVPVRSMNYFAEMGSGSEEGSYLRLTDFVYHSTLGLRVIKREEEVHVVDHRLDFRRVRVQP